LAEIEPDAVIKNADFGRLQSGAALHQKCAFHGEAAWVFVVFFCVESSLRIPKSQQARYTTYSVLPKALTLDIVL
jgi:hypothetical protein